MESARDDLRRNREIYFCFCSICPFQLPCKRTNASRKFVFSYPYVHKYRLLHQDLGRHNKQEPCRIPPSTTSVAKTNQTTRNLGSNFIERKKKWGKRSKESRSYSLYKEKPCPVA
jgi:hypothetical protein